jgi:hypothetical protein
MSKPNRVGTRSAAAQALRLFTLLLVGSIVAAAASVGFYLALSQTPPAVAQQPTQVRQQPATTSQQATQSRQQPTQTMSIPRTVTVEDADGTLRTQTVYETVRIPGSSSMVPVRVPRAGALPQTAADRHSFELATKLRNTEDANEAERLRSELLETLGKAFDERQQLQQQEMQRLEERLQSIRELSQRRQELKEPIIQRRLDELIGNSDMLAWDAAAAPPSDFSVPAVPHSRQPADAGKPDPRSGARRPAANDPFGASPNTPTDRNASADPFGADPFGSPPAVAAVDLFGRPLPMRPKAESRAQGATPTATPIPQPSDTQLELAERLLSLTSRVAALKSRIAAMENQTEDPNVVYYGQRVNVQQSLPALRAELRDTETTLRLAQIAWNGLGERLHAEQDAANVQASHARDLWRQMTRLHEQGATPVHEVKKAELASSAAQSQLQIAEGRLRTWQESDQLVKERLKATAEAPADPPEVDAATDEAVKSDQQ